MKFKSFKSIKSLDFIGIALSLACIAHCLFSLFFLLFSTFWRFEHADAGTHTHELMLMAAIVVGFFTFLKDFQKHRDISVLIFGGIGISCLGAGILLSHSAILDSIMTLLGCSFIIQAHWLNYKKTNYCHIKQLPA